MASCVADTSWLVGLLNADDDFHKSAIAEASTMEQIHVPPAILAETLSFIKYRTGKVESTREAVRFLSSKANVALSSPDHDHEATMRYWDAHPKLSYHDAAAVAAAKRLGIGICSFDDHQRDALSSGKP